MSESYSRPVVSAGAARHATGWRRKSARRSLTATMNAVHLGPVPPRRRLPMLAILNVVIPVFAIIGAGLSGRPAAALSGRGRQGAGGLRQQFRHALPAVRGDADLGFRLDVQSGGDRAVLYRLADLAAVGLDHRGQLVQGAAGEGVSSGFSAMFTNTVLIGIPIVHARLWRRRRCRRYSRSSRSTRRC